MWVDRIGAHMQENLSRDRQDFELQPAFTRHGAWGKAVRVFGPGLAGLLRT